MGTIQTIRKVWQQSAPLTAVCILMSAAFLASIAGLFLDHRIITGAPAWLKPAKFAISTAIYAGTLAWYFRYLTVWPRFTRAMGWVIAAVIVIEVGIIDAQAARGVASHFNVATPLDFVLFQIMGIAIGVLWLASAGILIALLRQRFTDPAWGWALRLGMLITVLGAGSGALMLRATPEQAAGARMHPALRASGGHTVGASDGGPGLPGAGWSTQHGDLRVPHFFGLHGIQIVPLFALFAGRRWRLQTAFITAVSYLGFIAILAWQALRGQSIIAPDAGTLVAFGIWLAGTGAALFLLPDIWTRDSVSQRAAATG